MSDVRCQVSDARCKPHRLKLHPDEGHRPQLAGAAITISCSLCLQLDHVILTLPPQLLQQQISKPALDSATLLFGLHWYRLAYVGRGKLTLGLHVCPLLSFRPYPRSRISRKWGIIAVCPIRWLRTGDVLKCITCLAYISSISVATVPYPFSIVILLPRLCQFDRLKSQTFISTSNNRHERRNQWHQRSQWTQVLRHL